MEWECSKYRPTLRKLSDVDTLSFANTTDATIA